MFVTSIRTGFVLLLVCTPVWALVLAWWADRLHTPSPRDLVLYMAVLPLALFGGYSLLRAFIDGLRRPASPAAAPQQTGTTTTAPQPDPPQEVPRRPIEGRFLHTALGTDATQLRDALRAGKRPGLDPELTDADGFPVFSGRIATLDCDELAARLDTLATRAGVTPIHQRAILRALAILEHILPDILSELGGEPLRSAAASMDAPPRLRWFVPHSWPSSSRPLLAAWLAERQEAFGCALGEPQIVPIRSAAELLRSLTDAIAAEADAKAPLLVMAADSSLAEDVVAAWERTGTLFSAQNEQGRIPGEAAAALLFAPARSAAGGTDCRSAELSATVHDQRAVPADANGRPRDETLASVRTRAMTQLAIEPARIGTVISDADHRTSCALEIFAALGDDFEHLDPAADVLAPGAGCGDTGIVAALLALALASEHAAQEARAALCLFAQDGLERAAVIVTPAPPEALS